MSERKAPCMLTTFDNPYNPFDDYVHWFLFDTSRNRDTSAYLSKFAQTSDSLTEEENDAEIERAIDEILEYDVTGLYRKIREGDKIVLMNELT